MVNFNETCSVVIGPKQVNYAILKKRQKSWVLKGAAFYDFELDKKEEFKDILSSVDSLLKNDILTNICFVHPDVIEHVFFYDLSASNIRANIYRDLKGSYEIELKDYLIDFEECVVSSKRAALVCAIPKSLFDVYYSVFKHHRKFHLFAVETPIVSLRRISLIANQGTKGTLCFAMFDEFSRIFSLLDESILVNRQVGAGFSQILSDIMEAGGISDIEAREMLSKYGLLDKDLDDERRIAFYNAVTSAFDRFSIEIQRTIDYLSTVQKMGAVESICTLGFVNRIKGIDAYLSKMFSLKANKVETQKMIEFDDDVDFSLIDKMLYFDICVGAGVRSVK